VKELPCDNMLAAVITVRQKVNISFFIRLLLDNIIVDLWVLTLE
jgi:hypothetical protein